MSGAAPPPDRRRGLRYLLVGAFNTAFGIAFFTLLHLTVESATGYILVLVVAWVVNVMVAFLTYRVFVFRVEGQILLDLLRFSTVYVGAFIFNLAALPFGVEVLGLPVLMTQFVVLGLTIVASYFSHDRFSFRRDPVDGVQPTGAASR